MSFNDIIHTNIVRNITQQVSTETKKTAKKAIDMVSTPDALKHSALAMSAIGMAGIAINQKEQEKEADEEYRKELEQIFNDFKNANLNIIDTGALLEQYKNSDGKYSTDALRFIYKYLTSPVAAQRYERGILDACKNSKNDYVPEALNLADILINKQGYVGYTSSIIEACKNSDNEIDKNALGLAEKISEKECHPGYIAAIIKECQDNNGNIRTTITPYIEKILDFNSQGYTTSILKACKNPDNTFNEKTLSLINDFVEYYDKNDIGYLSDIINACKDDENIICNAAVDLIKKQMNDKYETGHLTQLVKTCKEPDGTFNTRALEFAANINQTSKETLSYYQINGIIANCKYGCEIQNDALDFMSEYLKEHKYTQNSVCIIRSCLQKGDSQKAAFVYAKNILKNGYDIREIEKRLFGNNLEPQIIRNVNVKNVFDTALCSEKMLDAFNFIKNISTLLNNADDIVLKEDNLHFLEEIINDETISPQKIQNIIHAAQDEPRLIEVCKSLYKIGFPIDGIQINTIRKNLQHNHTVAEIILNHEKLQNKYKNEFEKINDIKLKMIKKPELYVNGEYSSAIQATNAISNWFYITFYDLVKLFYALDKESIDYLMRLRLDDAEEYVNNITEDFDKNTMELLKQLINAKDVHGNNFKPKEKLEMIDLIQGYIDNNLSVNTITKMIQEGHVDLDKLQYNLFRKIMLNAGMTDEDIKKVPDEKLKSWNMKYAHLLSKDISYTDDNSFEDIIKAANLYDFQTYIHDTSNKYGKTNAITKQMFKEAGMNYDTWINPKKEHEVHFTATDKNLEQLKAFTEDITKNMNILMKTPAKGLIKKQFKEFVKGDDFILPNDYSTNQTKLKNLLEKITNDNETGQLYQIWKRAKESSACGIPEREARAKGTLTILDHLKQKQSDIDKIKVNDSSKNLDLTIKMWDRIPQKDLFQGNYSSCCIGIGRGNGEYMPHYLMDTAFNMIEIVDNSGNVIGNALCYFVTDSNNRPAFIIDNIEISDAKKPSKEVLIQLRDAITKYADNVAKDVTEKDDTHIYISNNWNDITVDDLPQKQETVKFLGDISTDEIYLDLYHDGDSETILRKDLTRNNQLLQLK